MMLKQCAAQMRWTSPPEHWFAPSPLSLRSMTSGQNVLALFRYNRELNAGYLAEEVWRSFGSKHFTKLKIAAFHPDIRLEHIDGFTEAMFKAERQQLRETQRQRRPQERQSEGYASSPPPQ